MNSWNEGNLKSEQHGRNKARKSLQQNFALKPSSSFIGVKNKLPVLIFF